MRAFNVTLRSVRDVQDFVSLATMQPFPVQVGNELQRVNAKSFMAMFSLDCRLPLQVTADCDEAEFALFRRAAARFLAD